jgi:hypothetical protein
MQRSRRARSFQDRMSNITVRHGKIFRKQFLHANPLSLRFAEAQPSASSTLAIQQAPRSFGVRRDGCARRRRSRSPTCTQHLRRKLHRLSRATPASFANVGDTIAAARRAVAEVSAGREHAVVVRVVAAHALDHAPPLLRTALLVALRGDLWRVAWRRVGEGRVGQRRVARQRVGRRRVALLALRALLCLRVVRRNAITDSRSNRIIRMRSFLRRTTIP